MISTSSTIRPPLASDEDDFSDEENVITQPKRNSLKSYDSKLCDIPDIDLECKSKRKSYSSLNGVEHRQSWIYTNASCNFERLSNTFGLKTKSLFSLHNSQSDPHIHGIVDQGFYQSFFDSLKRFYDHDNVDCKIVPLFSVHPLQYDDDQIEMRPIVSPPSEVPRYKFLLKCLSLKLKLSIEPIFASIAIYDAHKKIKVTENFYFDMNSGL